MEKGELVKGKISFVTELYQYRENEICLLNNINSTREILDFFHARGILTDLVIKDPGTLISNKSTFLISSYNRSGLDYLFFKDYEKGTLYTSNFFGGVILRSVIKRMTEAEEALAAFVEGLVRFSNRLDIVCKKKIRAVSCLLQGKDYFEFDETAKNYKKEVYELYHVFKDKLDEYYKEDPFFNYPEMVEKRFIASEKKEDLKLDADKLRTFYEVDVDFLRNTNGERNIEKVKQIYARYMEKHGLDASVLDEECECKYFVDSQYDIFDPRPYFSLDIGKLARGLLDLQMEELSLTIGDEVLGPIKNIFNSIGVDLDEVEPTSGSSQPNSGGKIKK